MYSKIAVLAIWRFGHEWRWISSLFKVEMKLSAIELSWASATDPIQGRRPSSLSLLPNSTEVYWLPRRKLLYKSSGSFGNCVRLQRCGSKQLVDLASQIAFEAA